MLYGALSFKGSPGVTSLCLALAATWPRTVILLEADPAGGDLAFRCRAATGGPLHGDRGLVKLATSVRTGAATQDAVLEQAQLLSCGVNVVQGAMAATQTRGLRGGLWAAIARACVAGDVDVIADLGRQDAESGVLPLIQACGTLLPVATTTLESITHATHGAGELIGSLRSPGAVHVQPVLVGPEDTAGRDCADFGDMLERSGIRAAATMPFLFGPKALVRLEGGERAGGRFARTPLLRSAAAIAAACVGREVAA